MSEKEIRKNMTHCPVCGGWVAKSAKRCPSCGAKVNTGRRVLGTILIVFGVLIFLCAVFGGSSSSSSNQNQKVETSAKVSEKYEVVGGADSLEITYDGFAWYAEGILKNNTNKDISYLQISINLYDANGNSIGTAFDNTNNIPANGTWRFKAMSLDSYNDEIASYEIGDITAW